MTISETDPMVRDRLRGRLRRLYGEDADGCLERLLELIRDFDAPAPRAEPWDQRDAALITYGDQVRRDGEAPLRVLRELLRRTGLHEVLRIVHILPFFPYSSDDGFSVMDYEAVDPNLGGWDDVRHLAEDVDLMFDLVLNHASSQGSWFKAYLEGRAPYDGYFTECTPDAELSGVVRPRTSPLLTEVATSRGPRHVWTTFSADQIDLDYANPALLLEMIRILLLYVRNGSRVVRLDAIAYLWKRPGTSCLNLPETHEVVKLMRDVVDACAPGTILLTETNLPHDQNVSYFGDCDEAHMVYQFSLPPLLLYTFRTGNAGPLMRWLADLEPPPPGTTFFNFTASHDGIGLLPLRGLLDPPEITALAEAMRELGGHVSARLARDGSESPYELNITYFSALGDPGLPDDLHRRRFLSTQAIMLAMRGIPGVYFHSLIGTPNDDEGVRETGRARSINRRKLEADGLLERLADGTTREALVLNAYDAMLRARSRQPAFHPDAPQTPLPADEPSVVRFVRESRDGSQGILVIANAGATPVETEIPFRGADLLGGGGATEEAGTIRLEPYECRWLEAVD